MLFRFNLRGRNPRRSCHLLSDQHAIKLQNVFSPIKPGLTHTGPRGQKSKKDLGFSYLINIQLGIVNNIL